MKLIKLLTFVIVILFVGNITISNHSLDDSKKTAQLASEVAGLTHELTILKSLVAESTSLTSASTKVAAIGFSETPKIVTLGVTSHVASR